MVGELSLDFNDDGTVNMKPFKKPGAYKVEGNTITITIQELDITFIKDGDTLHSPDNTVAYTKK